MPSSKHVVSRTPPAKRDRDDAATGEWDDGEWDDGALTTNDPDTPVEQRFLLRLRDNPDDLAMRMVYSDWLEERGQSRKAEFLRLMAATPTSDDEIVRLRVAGKGLDRDWRAIVSRQPIDKCGVQFEFRCPKSWEALTSTDDTRVRHCTTCVRNVYFCSDLDEVRRRGRAGECVAFCATLVRSQALDEYEGYEMEMGEISVDDD